MGSAGGIMCKIEVSITMNNVKVHTHVHCVCHWTYPCTIQNIMSTNKELSEYTRFLEGYDGQ